MDESGICNAAILCVSFVAGVGCGSVGAGVEKWSDLTGQVEVGVSSRPAMVASLTDGSTGRPPRLTSFYCAMSVLPFFKFAICLA